MIRLIKHSYFALFLGVAFAGVAHAQGQQTHGDYTVYHTVFDSTFLQPEVAATYDLVRGEQIYLVNISVNAKGRNFGQAVKLEGTITNLMQQQKPLQFQEISEGEVTYYIAPLRVVSQDTLRFALNIQPSPDEAPFTIEFTQTLRKK